MKKLLTIITALALILGIFTGCSEILDELADEVATSSSRTTSENTTEDVTESTTGTSRKESTPTPAAPTATPSAKPTKTPTKAPTPTATPAPTQEPQPAIDRNGTYTSKDDVALYIHTYGELPSNFITKKEARELGWEGGSLEDYAPGKCIGGDFFGNYEGVLPDGRYHECDIDTLGRSSRGSRRLIYSDDGRIYYTDDHYESFTLLYGEE